MKEKIKLKETQKELSEAAKIDENATYYGVGKKVSIADDPVRYIDIEQIFCENTFLNWIFNFIAKGIYHITFKDVMLSPSMIDFSRGNPSSINYKAFIFVIVVFYITYKIIEKILVYFSETPDPFLTKIGVVIFLGLLLATFIIYISLYHNYFDNLLRQYSARRFEENASKSSDNKTVYQHVYYTYGFFINVYFFKKPILLLFSLSVFSKLAFYYLIFTLFFVTTKLGHSPTLSHIFDIKKKEEKTLVGNKKGVVTDFLKHPKQINNRNLVMYPKLWKS